MPTVAEELVHWAEKLPIWQQDALRRLVGCDSLTAMEEDEILALLKSEHGIAVASAPPAADAERDLAALRTAMDEIETARRIVEKRRRS